MGTLLGKTPSQLLDSSWELLDAKLQLFIVSLRLQQAPINHEFTQLFRNAGKPPAILDIPGGAVLCMQGLHLRPDRIVVGQPGNGRCEVINENSPPPTLRHQSFARGTENVGINQGKRSKRYLGVTITGKRRAFSRQVLQRRLRPQGDQRVDLALQIPVGSHPVMRGRDIRLVQNTADFPVAFGAPTTTLGLDHDQNIAEPDSGDEQAGIIGFLPVNHGITGKLSPRIVATLPNGIGKLCKIALVIFPAYARDDASFGGDFFDIGPSEFRYRLFFKNQIEKSAPAGGDIGNRIPFIPQPVHDCDGTFCGIKPRRCCDGGLHAFAGRLMKHYRHTLLRVRLCPQPIPACRPLGKVLDTFRNRNRLIHPPQQILLPRHFIACKQGRLHTPEHFRLCQPITYGHCRQAFLGFPPFCNRLVVIPQDLKNRSIIGEKRIIETITASRIGGQQAPYRSQLIAAVS